MMKPNLLGEGVCVATIAGILPGFIQNRIRIRIRRNMPFGHGSKWRGKANNEK